MSSLRKYTKTYKFHYRSAFWQPVTEESSAAHSILKWQGTATTKLASAIKEFSVKKTALNSWLRGTNSGKTRWFSVVDVIAGLTDSKNPRDYWYRMKKRQTAPGEVQLSTPRNGKDNGSPSEKPIGSGQPEKRPSRRVHIITFG